MVPIDRFHQGRYEFTVLVLQGGGALGSYQAGVFEALTEAGMSPNWVTGVSIGGINAAIIAGNPVERRVERLRQFWNRVTEGLPWGHDGVRLSAQQRQWLNGMSAATCAAFGVPNFYSPRVPPAPFMPPGTREALSYYDDSALRSTLEGLIDFDRINRGEVRLSLGATNVESGNSTYFDNHHMRIGIEHVLASGALPPAFAPVEINGQYYWDGGIVSNTPLWYVLDTAPPMRALVFQIDLFSASGKRPTNIAEVMERHKDISYSSKTRLNTTRVREQQQLRTRLMRLLQKLPGELRDDPDAKALGEFTSATHIDIVHLINRRSNYACFTKDYEFSRATMLEHWSAGLEDVRRSVAHPEWLRRSQIEEGIEVYDLTREAPSSVQETAS